MMSNKYNNVDLRIEDTLDAIERLEGQLKNARADYFTMCARHEERNNLNKQERLIAQIEQDLNSVKEQLTGNQKVKVNKLTLGL